ncbi:hypothetical protein FTV88_1976 [Heliorestis convoluta]|uniref:Uncharacterized protein n=1 Tax=Heliorestis convoluta TaxID=356322 RepID=A0A5Q2MYQ2_9FIRM|nr:hypothetical protein FTV88_1976 [Heliorestis convoluta]
MGILYAYVPKQEQTTKKNKPRSQRLFFIILPQAFPIL